MNTSLWITCGYVCAKALDNLWINLSSLAHQQVHPHVTQQLSTVYPQGLIGAEALLSRRLLDLLYLSTVSTTTTFIYLS